MKVPLTIAVAVLLAGCSTINSVGIGGPPRLKCDWSTGEADIDDKLVGSRDVHASVVRRFPDGDASCASIIRAKAEADAAIARARAEAEALRAKKP